MKEYHIIFVLVRLKLVSVCVCVSLSIYIHREREINAIIILFNGMMKGCYRFKT